jgi:hypothetical protein
MCWNHCTVPGSDHLAALKGKSRPEDGPNGLTLAYMSAYRLTLVAKGVMKAIRQKLAVLFGESPL